MLIMKSCLLSAETNSSDRRSKLLNVFTIVNFPNDACNTTDNRYGVCYTATECSALGGTNKGTNFMHRKQDFYSFSYISKVAGFVRY